MMLNYKVSLLMVSLTSSLNIMNIHIWDIYDDFLTKWFQIGK
jgi:hypothetical protein